MGFISELLGGSEWRDKPKEEKAADIDRHRATRQALEASYRHAREVGPTYYLFNAAVIDAEKHVPWWRR